MQERVLYGTTTRQSEKATAQVRLARAEIEAREAEDLLRKVAANVMELRERATPEDRNRWVASLAYAVDRSKRVIGSIAEASGASAHLLTHALQRAKRDVDTLSSHTIFDLDGRLESYGRVLLGLEPNGPF
jgi:DNA-binding MurR/RpiR family transcriptional regulator